LRSDPLSLVSSPHRRAPNQVGLDGSLHKLPPFVVIKRRTMVLSITFIVFDRTRLANFVALHGWGLYGAELWIKHHYKQEGEEVVTSLKL
jgi:hypothetical protein